MKQIRNKNKKKLKILEYESLNLENLNQIIWKLKNKIFFPKIKIIIQCLNMIIVKL